MALLVLLFVNLQIFGFASIRVLLLPFVLIFIALPMWHVLQVGLQSLSAAVVELALPLVGIPLLREGFEFVLPGGSFSVERGCSGLGFFMVALTLALLHVYLNRLRSRQAMLVLLVALGLALLANWLRIISIMLLGNEQGMQHPLVQDHLVFGWLVFGVMMLPMMWLFEKIPASVLGGTERIWVLNWLDGLGAVFGRRPVSVSAALVAITVGLAFPVGAALLKYRAEMAGPVPLYGNGQPELAGMTAFASEYGWQPDFPGALQKRQGTMLLDGVGVEFYRASFGFANEGEELVGEHNALYPATWQSAAFKYLPGQTQGATIGALKLLNDRGRNYLLAYRYRIQDRFVAEILPAK